jgi:hypothetical protein
MTFHRQANLKPADRQVGMVPAEREHHILDITVLMLNW